MIQYRIIGQVPSNPYMENLLFPLSNIFSFVFLSRIFYLLPFPTLLSPALIMTYVNLQSCFKRKRGNTALHFLLLLIGSHFPDTDHKTFFFHCSLARLSCTFVHTLTFICTVARRSVSRVSICFTSIF